MHRLAVLGLILAAAPALAAPSLATSAPTVATPAPILVSTPAPPAADPPGTQSLWFVGVFQ